jgi:hypothetical protein
MRSQAAMMAFVAAAMADSAMKGADVSGLDTSLFGSVAPYQGARYGRSSSTYRNKDKAKSRNRSKNKAAKKSRAKNRRKK